MSIIGRGGSWVSVAKQKQVEKVVIIVLTCLVIVGLVVAVKRDIDRKNYLEELHQQNLNAPIEEQNVTPAI